MVARMHAVVGNVEQALSALTQCFEAVSPSRLELLKSHTQQCKDFSAVACARFVRDRDADRVQGAGIEMQRWQQLQHVPHARQLRSWREQVGA